MNNQEQSATVDEITEFDEPMKSILSLIGTIQKDDATYTQRVKIARSIIALFHSQQEKRYTRDEVVRLFKENTILKQWDIDEALDQFDTGEDNA